MKKRASSHSTVQDWFRKYPVFSFILLTCLLSWLCWLPILPAIKADVFSSAPHIIFLLLAGGYSPSLSAMLVTLIQGGRKQVKELLGKFMILRVGFRWYMICLFMGPAMLFLSTMLYVAWGGEVGWTNYMVFLFLPVFFLIASLFGPLGEELGWRGYLLPAVLKYGFWSSSVFVGIVWTCWHAPLFWAAEGTSISGMPVTFFTVLKYLIFVTGTSVLYTWVFKRTRGSVFMAVLIHAAFNGSHMALSYLFPNIENKKAIWEIEVWILALPLMVGAIAGLRKLLDQKAGAKKEVGA